MTKAANNESTQQHISEIPDGVCAFCQSDDVLVPEVGISFSMAGYDYSFCRKCLSGMTGEEFWQRLFAMNEYQWPPALVGKRRGNSGT